MTPASRFRLNDALLTNTSNPFQNKVLDIVSRSQDIWNKKLMDHIKVILGHKQPLCELRTNISTLKDFNQI